MQIDVDWSSFRQKDMQLTGLIDQIYLEQPNLGKIFFHT